MIMKRKLYQCLIKRRPIYLLFLILTYSTTTLAQQAESAKGIIKGKVTDASGETLPGVAIRVEGSPASATTDPDGNYLLSVAPGTYTVTASYVGFNASVNNNIAVAAGEQKVLNIRMTANTLLKEVVVSYGKQREREVTGSIATVDASTLQDMPVGQFAQQLQGKVAGVQISQSSGQPGRGMEFRIRGAASLSANNQPLFVIDGLPITGSINNINPSEIETFTVLKDASATALYGSRAANGVILITTKHAKPGDSKIQFNSNYGIQKIPMKRVPVMMDARGFATYMKERYEDQKRDVPSYKVPPEQLEAYENPEQYGKGTDWFDLLTQTAPIQSYDLTIQSAREKSSSTIVAGYQSQEGVIINTGTKLFTLRLNQDLSIGDKLKVGFNVAPSYRLDHNNRTGTDAVAGVFERLFESSPLISPFNPDGSYTKFVHSPGMVNYINPLAIQMLGVDDYRTTRILGNAFLNYELLPGLSLKTNLGADKGAETRTQFTPSTITSNSKATGISSSVDNYSWTAEGTLNYSKTFLEDHNVEALIGYSAQRYNGENNSVNGTEFPNDDVPYIRAATSITAGSSTHSQYSLLSTIARLNYNYKGKYLLQGAIRRDGSSRFGEDRKYGYFPSISGGWIVSDESFMERFNFIDLLKLRASYGITGNNEIGNFTQIARLGEYNYHFNNILFPGQTISGIGNSALGWERNKQFDIGFDLELLQNRISVTYDYYHRISDGLIMDRKIPRASGFTEITTNIGEFEFWGHEIGVNTTNLTGKLKWNTNFNISFDRNIINKLVSPGFFRRNNTITSDYYRIQEGQPLGTFFGFIHEGLYKDAEDLANSPKYGDLSDVGTLKMRDISGPNGVPDGVITNDDRTFIGDPTPDFTFGLTNNFRYKQFDLNISMAGSVGGQILSAARWAYQTNLDGSRVMLAAAADRWRSPENPGSGIYPRTKHNTTAIGRSVNSQWVENGSYLTAKNISLGYTFNMKNNLMLKGLRVYGSVQQAFIITGFSGMNPEINNQGLDATKGIGVDENAYPIPRTFSIGLSTTFK